jgi:hypothetical protein
MPRKLESGPNPLSIFGWYSTLVLLVPRAGRSIITAVLSTYVVVRGITGFIYSIQSIAGGNYITELVML